MSKLRNSSSIWVVLVVVVVAFALAGVLTAKAKENVRLGMRAGHQHDNLIFEDLPALPRGAMTITPGADLSLQVLSFDDGTCESGLGAGVTVSSLVDFDVPTSCEGSGLQVVQMTARMNTGNAQAAVLHQGGATPNPAGAADSSRAIGLAGIGPCPGTTLSTASFAPMTVTGSDNFFAGLQNTGFAGRDTNGPSSDRIWLNCAACGDTQYSPTDLNGIGLGGAHMIRVTVEDAGCVPVELMSLDTIGACPGPIQVVISGATPGGTVGVAFSPNLGSFTFPGGPCAGTEMGLETPKKGATGTADGSGNLSFTPTAPPQACGFNLQGLDLSACITSNTEPIGD